MLILGKDPHSFFPIAKHNLQLMPDLGEASLERKELYMPLGGSLHISCVLPPHLGGRWRCKAPAWPQLISSCQGNCLSNEHIRNFQWSWAPIRAAGCLRPCRENGENIEMTCGLVAREPGGLQPPPFPSQLAWSSTGPRTLRNQSSEEECHPSSTSELGVRPAVRSWSRGGRERWVAQ